MQNVSADFQNAVRSPGRQPVSMVEIDWAGSAAFSGAMGSSTWSDETDYVLSHTGQMKINPPGERLVPAGQVSQATITLDNADRRFSWQRTDSPLYAYIGGATGLSGKKIRIWQGFRLAGGIEYVRIFSGFIADWTEGPDGSSVVLNCWDRGWRLLQDKRSTTIYENQRIDQWIQTVMGLAGFGSPHMNLDVGLFHIPYCWMDDESIVEEVWRTAEADAGLVYFDQLGILQYKTPLSWVSGSPVWSFTSDDWDRLEPRTDTSAMATKVIVEWSGRRQGPEGVIYELDDQKVIPPGSSVEFVARFDYPVLEVFQPSVDEPYSDWSAISLGGADMASQLTVTLSETYAQQTKVTLANGDSTRTMYVNAFKLRGRPLIGGPTEQIAVDVDPAPYNWQRIRSERGNVYIQTYSQAKAMAELLAQRAKRVHSIYVLRGCSGIPQLELTDIVTISAPRLASADLTGAVVGIDWIWSTSAGFQQDISVLDLTDMLAYDNYFRVGVDTLGAHARAYY